MYATPLHGAAADMPCAYRTHTLQGIASLPSRWCFCCAHLLMNCLQVESYHVLVLIPLVIVRRQLRHVRGYNQVSSAVQLQPKPADNPAWWLTERRQLRYAMPRKSV